MILASFIVFLLLSTLVGVLSSIRKENTTEDYLIAGRSVSPWLTALSAVATNNSGFMFIGLIGYTYRLGVESVWMMAGWILGDLTAWVFVHHRIRRHSEHVDVSTVPSLMGTHPHRTNRVLIAAGGVLTFLLLGVYAAAQLKAGSAALHTLFGWDLSVGAIIGAVIVVVYCFSGGIRASIWTDAAQSIVMIAAMAILLGSAMWTVGGPAALWENLAAQDPQLVEWFPRNLQFGFSLYLLGMLAGGFGAVGQPHILVRFMAIQSVTAIKRAAWIYFAWFVPFFALGILTGLYARAVTPDITALDVTAGLSASQAAELAMPQLAITLLPDVLIGLTLAGLFSATMSTADSQVLVCSGALTQDIYPKWQDSYAASKAGTLLVAALALGIALFAGQGVFALVLIAWSGLGAGIGSVLLLRVFGVEVTTTTGLAMMVSGVGTVVAWVAFGLNGQIFELLPGLAAAFVAYGVCHVSGLQNPVLDQPAEAVPAETTSQQ